MKTILVLITLYFALSFDCPKTVTFQCGEPNRTILVFEGTECKGDAINYGVTDANGNCDIVFNKDCNSVHTVRVNYDEMPADYIAKGMCQYFYPVNVDTMKVSIVK
jgi:hypothetical protein